MTDYRALAAEELLPEYNGMTDAQKVAAIKAKVVPLTLDLDPADVQEELQARGVWGRYVLASRMAPLGTLDAPDPQDVRVARIIEIVEIARTGLPTARTAPRNRFIALIADMRTAGDMSSALESALTAMTAGSIRRSAQLGFPDLTRNDLLAARKVAAGG